MTNSPMTSRDKPRKGIFFVLWFLCLLGSWSVLPYAQGLGIVPLSVSFAKIFLLTTVQSMILFGIVCSLSYLLIQRTDLSPFVADKPLQRIVYPGVLAGSIVGLILCFLDITLVYTDRDSRIGFGLR